MPGIPLTCHSRERDLCKPSFPRRRESIPDGARHHDTASSPSPSGSRVIPANADLCITVIPAQADLWNPGVIPAQSLPSRRRGRESIPDKVRHFDTGSSPSTPPWPNQVGNPGRTLSCSGQHSCATLLAWNTASVPVLIPIPFRQARLGTRRVVSRHGVPTQIGRTRNRVCHLPARCATRQIRTAQNGTKWHSFQRKKRQAASAHSRGHSPHRVRPVARSARAGLRASGESETAPAARRTRRRSAP